MQHPTYTSEFHHEFEAETSHLLRRRFLWFTGVMAALTIGVLVLMALRPPRGAETLPPAVQSAPDEARQPLEPPSPSAERADPPQDGPPRRPGPGRIVREIARDLSASPPTQYDVVITALRALNFLAFFFIAARVRLRDVTVLRLTFTALVLDGVLLITARFFDATGGLGIAAVTLTHLLACCFLPWTPRQALAPILPLLVLDAAIIAILPEYWWAKVTAILISPLFALPGTLICWARHTRRLASFKVRFLESRLGSLRQELLAARRIHEALFPSPEARGFIRFNYRYTPMRLIGGDYLHTRFDPAPPADQSHPFNMLLLDVTGHGIPAAITVNRLYGELERLYAEEPDIRPGAIVRGLNRYIYLTLSDHALFVTALAVRIDPAAGTLEYCNAGHPPAFVRGPDGTLDQLDSTTCVLGVFKDSEFDPASHKRPLGPGDVLIAYTDGAMETKNALGRMLGVDGIRKALLSTPMGKSYAEHLMAAVDGWRHGPVADDTLIVEVFRELVSQSVASKPPSIAGRPSGIFGIRTAPAPTSHAATGAHR